MANVQEGDEEANEATPLMPNAPAGGSGYGINGWLVATVCVVLVFGGEKAWSSFSTKDLKGAKRVVDVDWVPDIFQSPVDILTVGSITDTTWVMAACRSFLPQNEKLPYWDDVDLPFNSPEYASNIQPYICPPGDSQACGNPEAGEEGAKCCKAGDYGKMDQGVHHRYCCMSTAEAKTGMACKSSTTTVGSTFDFGTVPFPIPFEVDTTAFDIYAGYNLPYPSAMRTETALNYYSRKFNAGLNKKPFVVMFSSSVFWAFGNWVEGYKSPQGYPLEASELVANQTKFGGFLKTYESDLRKILVQVQGYMLTRYHKPCFMMRTQHTISEFHGYDAPASAVKMMNGVIAKVCKQLDIPVFQWGEEVDNLHYEWKQGHTGFNPLLDDHHQAPWVSLHMWDKLGKDLHGLCPKVVPENLVQHSNSSLWDQLWAARGKQSAVER